MSSTKGLAYPAVLWVPGGPIEAGAHRDVVLAIPRRATFLKTMRVPNVAKAEVAQALAVQLPAHFPAAAGELAFDFRLTGEVGPEGRLAAVGAVRTAQLREAVDAAHEAGMRPVAVIPVAFGSPALARELGRADAAVVEETPEGLAIDLVANGELLYSRLAPAPRSEAEIEGEVARTFGIAGMHPSPTIVAGGLKLESAEVKTSKRPIDYLTRPDQIGIHLELPELRIQRAKARQAARVRVFSVLTFAAVVLAGLLYFDRAEAASARQSAQAKWNARINKEKRLAQAAEAKVKEEEAIAKRLTLAFEPAQRVQDLATVVANSAPRTIWLTGLSVERGRRLTVRGTATTPESVSGYQQALSASDRFRDVKLELASSVQIEKTPVVQFSISMHAVGNLPVIEKDRETRRR